MKQILTLALLCLACSFSSKAQIVTNDTDCDIIITPICYNSTCGKTAGMPTNVNRRTAASLPPACGVSMAYEICWMGPICPPPICIEVNASNPPSPCNPAQWTATLGTCLGCTISGDATVTYDPITGDVLIN